MRAQAVTILDLSTIERKLLVDGRFFRPFRHGRWSAEAVTTVGTRYRISILAFDEATRLSRAAHELLLSGYTANQFCLFGCPFLFESSNATPPATQALSVDLDGLLEGPTRRVRLAATDVLEMRCGTLADSLFTPIESGIVEAKWMRPDLAHSLATDVASGCIVLLVTSTTADQHALGARLLLRHGTRNLHTHEFSVSQS
jgi:hypothetical protein